MKDYFPEFKVGDLVTIKNWWEYEKEDATLNVALVVETQYNYILILRLQDLERLKITHNDLSELQRWNLKKLKAPSKARR